MPAARLSPYVSPNPLLSGAIGGPIAPAGVNAYAPQAEDVPAPALPAIPPSPVSRSSKPQPMDAETIFKNENLRSQMPALGGSSFAGVEGMPLPRKIAAISSSLDRIETSQIVALGAIEARARLSALRMRQAIVDIGLNADRLSGPASASANGKAGEAAIGGPFIPMKINPHATIFEREAARLQSTLLSFDRLQRALPGLPVRRPLGPGAEQTSNFGARIDPFLGRAAMHSGIDFRDDYGAPIRAAGAGRVVASGYSGGYGNLVEIDHGNGLSTRYAHMSSVAVDEGQWLEPGALVGRLGSTGRSTGPHLHFEVRVEGEAVDPARFLRAGARLLEGE